MTAGRWWAIWAIVVASAIALLGVVVAVRHHPRPDATAAAPVSSALSAKAPVQCPDAGLALMLTVNPATAGLGQPVAVRLRVRHSGGRPCTRAFDSFTVTTQWKEPTPYHWSTCKAGATVLRTLAPGEEFDWAATTWAASPGGCPWAPESIVPVAPGTWHGTITAHYADRSSTVMVTITNT